MTKRSSKKGSKFFLGFIIGALVTLGILYCYDTYFRKSEVERQADKLKKEAQKTTDAAKESIKKIFE